MGRPAVYDPDEKYIGVRLPQWYIKDVVKAAERSKTSRSAVLRKRLLGQENDEPLSESA